MSTGSCKRILARALLPDRGPGPRQSVGHEVTLSGEPARSDRVAAREAWVLATLPRAVAYAASLLRDRALAEDVVHDCYVRLLRKSETYDLPRDGTRILFRAIT